MLLPAIRSRYSSEAVAGTLGPCPSSTKSNLAKRQSPSSKKPTILLVGKYLDHVPLYRQEAFFGRAGLAISRSTLDSWVRQCGVQLQPLVDVDLDLPRFHGRLMA